MPALYLTPASLSYLTLFIMSLAICGFLAFWLRMRNLQLALLTAFFAFTAIFIGALFLDTAFLPTPRLYAVYLENTVLAIVILLLLQFA